MVPFPAPLSSHLKMLHSGSSLMIVGSSTYSNFKSFCMRALSTVTDTLTFPYPCSEAWERHVIHWPPLLWQREREREVVYLNGLTGLPYYYLKVQL